MASPAPTLKIPTPGARSQSGSRTPRLKLGIPPSPNIKPVTGDGQSLPAEIPQLRPSSRPNAPKLSVATPMGSSHDPSHAPRQVRPLDISAATSSEASAHSRSGSFGPFDGKASGPASANSSQFSGWSGLKGAHMETPDPSSAISSVYSEAGIGGVGMEREGSMQGLLPDLEKLSLEKGRPLDVEDLDDDAWLAASEQKKILELGSLGEGAGGAVTKCRLDGGSTVFALKVRTYTHSSCSDHANDFTKQIITTDPNPDVKKQIFRELSFNKNCASEHICQYYGAFMDKSSSTISIAMEYCEGGSLDAVYKEVKQLRGRTGEKVLGKVAEGVLRGLTYLNGRKIIHRGKSTHLASENVIGKLNLLTLSPIRHQTIKHTSLP